MNSIFSRILFLSLLVISITSCDKDANDIGANIIGDDHFGFSSYTDASIVAYNQATNEVQTDNLEVNQLGIYDNPVFGKTVASVAVQLLLSNENQYPADDPATAVRVVKNVVLEVPYFSHPDDATAVSPRTYTLDSIVGTKTNKLKLSVFKNGKEISNTNLSNGTQIRNYSDSDYVSSTIGSRLNNDSDTSQNDEFVFDKSEHIITTTATNGTITTTYTAPSMKLYLDHAMGTEILTSGSNLIKNSEFVKFHKGLYFKVEQSGSNQGCLAMLNFKKATVTISYSFKDVNNTTEVDRTMVLGVGNTVNILQHTNSAQYSTAIASANTTSGDKKLFLKGGNGSVGYIDLFASIDNVGFDRTTGKIVTGSGGNGVPDELDYLKAKGWLINEANLVFNIDQPAMSSILFENQPNRILVYNANNKIPVTDYYYDNTSSTKANRGKIVYNGFNTSTQYKVRITNYIRNLVNKDSTNVKLGICVNQNINNVVFSAKKSLTTEITNNQWTTMGQSERKEHAMKFVPNASIMNPLGTVLYGNNFAPTDADYAKRLKLEIWYTKP